MAEHVRPSATVPFEVQKEMLESLFGSITILYSGLAAHIVCMVVCWAATHDPFYFLGIPFFSANVLFRYVTFSRFKAAVGQIHTEAELRRWERLYIIGAFLVCGGVGSFAGYAVVMGPGTIAPAMGMGLVGGSMISVVGRNFSSIRNAQIMTYSCCLPLVAGFLVGGWQQGDYLIALTAIPLIVVISTSNRLSLHLNELLVGALKARRKSEVGSQKFNAAISSLPNGLIMVDGNQEVVVANGQAAEMLGLDEMTGKPLTDALGGKFRDTEAIMAVISLAASHQEDFERTTFEANDGRHLSFRARHLDASETRFLDTEWGGKQEGAYVLTVLDVSKKVEADREISHLARYDGLTQIANRTHWETTSPRLVEELPQGSLVGLAVLDVDRFKLINDTLGHHIGDEVIAGVARRLNSVGDERMFVGRLGGDEFVVLIPGIRGIEDAKHVFDRVFSAVSCTYEMDSHNVEVRCSGGVIVRKREDFNLHIDMSRADMALYKVKRNPDRAWMIFDEELEMEFESTSRIKHDLRDAIENERLEVVYQPIYDAKGETIISAEALSRWEHPQAGNIPPSQFIAMAEEIGLIGKLTAYVLRVACRDCMSWNPNVTVSVNLSALDLARDGIVETISSTLEANGMQPSRLCIEVTESVFVKDFEKTAATLRRLRAIGVKTSLDDFGTGYSSLSYMHRLPLNRVKIDRSFVLDIVSEPNTQQLFGAVVALAKGLGFEVIVEGVEERGQRDYVVSVPGVDMIQGHIYSPDLTQDEMVKISNIGHGGLRGGKVVRLA